MKLKVEKILVIQTAFIGDVILSTSILEKLHIYYPEAKLDLIIKKGNESLFTEHPFLRNILTLNKAGGKWKNLFELLKIIRKEKYDIVINLHRFFSGGFMAAFSAGHEIRGFGKNPFSLLFDKKYHHSISIQDKDQHEIKRNHIMISDLTDTEPAMPKLYPNPEDISIIHKLIDNKKPFITIAPASVWFTKQWPVEKWIQFLKNVPDRYTVFCLGAPSDKILCENILSQVPGKKTKNLSGKLTLLQSAALMKEAEMNFVNDSAPLHLASAMNAPVTAIFCSTVPEFGFGPLSEISYIVESQNKLSCRPCGLHGKKYCPKGHFRCADIDVNRLAENIETNINH